MGSAASGRCGTCFAAFTFSARGGTAMAIIFGEKDSGKNGELSHDEFAKLLHAKSGGRAALKNCGVCVTHIENMVSTAGQGGITTKYAGRTVFHISSGKRGGGDGCSTFFTLSADSGPILTAGIVAVGWHHGAGEHSYRLDWAKGAPFFADNVLDTSTQHQTGNQS